MPRSFHHLNFPQKLQPTRQSQDAAKPSELLQEKTINEQGNGPVICHGAFSWPSFRSMTQGLPHPEWCQCLARQRPGFVMLIDPSFPKHHAQGHLPKTDNTITKIVQTDNVWDLFAYQGKRPIQNVYRKTA
jgi:hypothetical protein